MRLHGMDSPANRIQRRRLELGLTQAAACRLAGLPRATWSAVESGASAHPLPRTKVRIARALATTPTSIWRQQPPPLHLHDVEDPRWERAVHSVAQELREAGTVEQRRRFGEHLIGVLDCADPGAPRPRPDAAGWERLWRIGGELAGVPAPEPIAIVDGRLVEAGHPILAPPPEAGEITIRRSRADATRRGPRGRHER
jgi:transcriptional regulator with XRE-family HTH domain